MEAPAYPLPRAGLLLAGLGAALVLRLAVAGGAGVYSVPAGIIFAAVLLAVAGAAGWRPGRPRLTGFLICLAGAGVLVAVPLWLRLSGAVEPLSFPLAGFLPWALVVSAVAVGEELLLRGILFTLVQRVAGPITATGITAIAFGLLHVPLYGWHVLPLDLAVGVWLGGLRVVSGGVTAPAVAHTLADLAAWWLV